MSQNPHTEIQVMTVTLHPRGCRRSLDKVKTLSTDAVHPANIQGYLSHWATWWATAIRLTKTDLLTDWVNYTKKHEPEFVWLGRGLVPRRPSAKLTVNYNLNSFAAV